ncbi:MAG: hypothetical protein IKC07_05705, partial [Clostridia bacterium]|nr:hypothetical protein [Clostridia bacterium]
ALLCAWTLIAVTGNNFKLTTETADNSVDAVANETDVTMAAAETVHDLLTDDMQGAPLMPDGMIEDAAVENDEPSYVNGEPYEEVTSPAHFPDDTVAVPQTTAEKEFPIVNRVDATTTMVTEPVDVDGKVQSTMEPTVDNVSVATMPVAYDAPIVVTKSYQKGKDVVISFENCSGQTIETGYDYFLFRTDGVKAEMMEVAFIEILMIIPDGNDITLKIDTTNLSDGEYLVRKQFQDIDYTVEVSFRIENGVAVFPGK